MSIMYMHYLNLICTPNAPHQKAVNVMWLYATCSIMTQKIFTYNFVRAEMNRTRCGLAADQRVTMHELTTQNIEITDKQKALKSHT